jgi:3-oxoacyl-(acyl-carrier-protein) synthase
MQLFLACLMLQHTPTPCVLCLQHEEFYNNLLAGKSGVTEISTFDASQFTTRFAGEIKVRTPA